VSGILNSNISLQDTEVNILEAEIKDQSFQEKWTLWERRAKSGNFAKLTLFEEIASDSVPPVEPKVYESLVTPLDNLKINIEAIIPTGSIGDIWVPLSFIFKKSNILSRDTVIIDGVWNGNWIFLNLTEGNCKKLQRYS
jgi:hypothetical protein